MTIDIAVTARGIETLMDRNNDLEPRDWPLGDKLRLHAFTLDAEDIESGVFDEHEVQDDFRTAAWMVDAHHASAAEAVAIAASADGSRMYRSVPNPISAAVLNPSNFASAEELMDWLVRAGIIRVVVDGVTGE